MRPVNRHDNNRNKAKKIPNIHVHGCNVVLTENHFFYSIKRNICKLCPIYYVKYVKANVTSSCLMISLLFKI